jgi:NADH dehydrogenase FAD-containing subunit
MTQTQTPHDPVQNYTFEPPQHDRPRVVVVGGGFGGIHAVKALRRTHAQVILIDRHNHHVFQPLLYQVATSILSPADIASPLRQVFRRQRNVIVAQAEVVGVDASRRLVHIGGERSLEYDYLVLAMGAQSSYFGHDEFADHAPALKSLADADLIRNRILAAFEICEKQIRPTDHPELLTFVLVGAGPTGVELAGAIAQLARNTLASEFRRYDPRSLRIVLVQGAPRILPTFDEKLSMKAQKKLESLGIEVRTSSRVELVDAAGVVVGGERIHSRNVFWTAGVTPPPIADWLGSEADRTHRVKVNSDCSVPNHPEIFVIGDAASHASNGKPLPGLAQVAMQQGSYVGALVKRRMARKPSPRAFRYWDKGTMAAVVPGFTVLQGMGLRMAGFLATIVWAVVHIAFLALPSNRIRTLLVWTWTIITHRRTDCLIIEPKALPKPPLELPGT